MAFEFQRLKAENDIVEIINRFVPLKKHGSEHHGICPWHTDNKPSLTVNGGKQLFFCPVCADRKGDVFDFLQAWGYTIKESAEYLHGGPIDKPAPARRQTGKQKQQKQVTWTQLIPEDAGAPDMTHYRFGKPARYWTYTTPDGYVWGYVCRFNMPDGSKEVLPLIYATNGKIKGWRWQAFDRPRPLLNLHHLKKCETVVVVEGEKTAEAVQKLLGASIAVTTWTGGTNAVQLTDFAPLHGKIVILWPDNDIPGRKAMRYIDDAIKHKAKLMKYVHVPEDLPKGWDGADGEFDEEKLRAWLRIAMHDEIFKSDEPPTQAAEPTDPPPFDVDEPAKPVQTAKPVQNEPPVKAGQGRPLTVNPWAVKGAPVDAHSDAPKPQQQAQPAQPIQQAAKPPQPPKKAAKKEDPADNPYFKVLGFEMDDNGAVYVFFQKRLNCVVRATIGGLTKNFFAQLAPSSFWDMLLPDCNTMMQIQWVIYACGEKLVFNEAAIRGRGAWHDDGRAILHVGNRLFVNGQTCTLGDFMSDYIYQAGEKMDFEVCQPLPAQQSRKLTQIMRRLKWERSVDADLLVGWCVVAIICGALDWRPHIWITGPAGSGKSWVFENVVSRILGNISLRVQGETTEAGVRQSLGHDARPVIFDEGEAEGRKGVERMQSLLTLMRGSSTSDGGVTAKGSSGGAARTYKIRSCFAFASIAVPISQQSDRSRISMLTLEGNGLKENEWEQFKKDVFSVITEEFIAALRNRAVQLMPQINRNAKVFAKACAQVLGSQRAGDQAGALLAGWFSLESDDIITDERALQIAQAHDWTEEKGHDSTRDEMRLFNFLMQQLTKVDADGHFERSIAELILVAAGKTDHIATTVIIEKLARIGFKVSEDRKYIIISDSMDPIVRMLVNTSWHKNHNKILTRIQGARPMTTVRFGVQTTRAVAIPMHFLQSEAEQLNLSNNK